MDLATIQLPVFLPGNNRNWKQVDGVARITSEGEVVVKLNPENAESLVEMAKRGILVQLAFDYKMPIENIELINTQYQKEQTPKHQHRFLYDGYSSTHDAHIYVCECSEVKTVSRQDYVRDQKTVILDEHSSGHVVKVGEQPWICVCGETFPSGAAWSEHSAEMDKD